ncbi:MAG TPA: TipAS antibiotic-recognition domain-containing protein, partial [Petrotogaceae bacterium]|nr:TipAS antibiotic-recognition domain-containing protein [Petrotogaceae bacterium]
QRLDELINNVDKNIKALEGGLEMNEEDMFSPFEDKKIREYTQQAKEKYSSSLVEQSIEKVSAYSKKEWEDIMEYGDSLMKEMKELMNRDPADKTVQNVISKHYKMINDNFYDCSIEIYSGLADLYVSDERFTAFFEKYSQGLAKYMHDAIKVFCSEKR